MQRGRPERVTDGWRALELRVSERARERPDVPVRACPIDFWSNRGKNQERRCVDRCLSFVRLFPCHSSFVGELPSFETNIDRPFILFDRKRTYVSQNLSKSHVSDALKRAVAAARPRRAPRRKTPDRRPPPVPRAPPAHRPPECVCSPKEDTVIARTNYGQFVLANLKSGPLTFNARSSHLSLPCSHCM